MTAETRDPAPTTGAAEEAAWASLRARWDDPLAHRDFLAGAGDLPGLARAGARYRAALEERPDDPVAAAGRDEVLRRATLLGLAAAPRPDRPVRASRWVKNALLAVLAILGAGLAAWAAAAFLRAGAPR